MGAGARGQGDLTGCALGRAPGASISWRYCSQEGGPRFLRQLPLFAFGASGNPALIQEQGWYLPSLSSAVSSGQTCDRKTRDPGRKGMNWKLTWEHKKRQRGGRCWRMVRKESRRGSEYGGLQPSHSALLSACLSCLVVFGFL